MRLAVLSDLHLSVAGMPAPTLDCDVIILAGDIARPPQAIEWARQFSQPVIYVPGNHEYYGGSLSGTLPALRELSAGTQVHVLDRGELRTGGVRFLGCTLWSDFRLLEGEAEQAASMAAATQFIRDFSRITLSDDSAELFTPIVSRQLFDQSVDWLEARFSEPFVGPTVMVSHHAPTRGSINPKYSGSPVNPSFVSDLEPQLRRWQPSLWVHGHVHDSYDYQVGNTRVVCNPRGYARSGNPENPAFDAQFVISI
ncbi:MAG: metallophosphoesterase [Gallionellales bacterium RBG_16_56_9]|nr:MAG: metallophosphoesterase [Gallionellales bacterium RBG_16_56_9]